LKISFVLLGFYFFYHYCIAATFLFFKLNLVLTITIFCEFHNHKGGSIVASFADSFSPLYFTMTQIKEVLSTEQPCDLAYEFGDGLYDIKELPLGFPKPGKGYFISFIQR
jgi:hypothetical protein